MPTIREKKYCSCVIKVSGNNSKKSNNDNSNQSPYGLCTFSLVAGNGGGVGAAWVTASVFVVVTAVACVVSSAHTV